ncbi:NAD(P)H-binding protein [Streptomyces marincola]|uniref:NAD(P)H-binding protein n=1 Tax=Streptomyces marincola TaxID=2878388 RepID=UPI001CF4F14C|nr:NAD(P)H-binding protein [Streptomyces marincola]UCM88975.1 NAD(P)H-binding protein [Streptomyces marincola]
MVTPSPEGPSDYAECDMILVTGATGSIGRHLVRRLAAENAEFTALVRTAAAGRALGCPYVVGDFDDPGSLAAAFGPRGRVSRLLLNTAGAVPVPDGTPQPMVRRQLAAIDAARAAGVERVVKISAFGAAPGGKLSVGAHGEIERYLERSGLSWSMLRPNGFMQNFATGDGGYVRDGALVGTFGAGRVAYVDARDVAACAAVLLTGDRGAGEVFVPTGPEALTHREIARRLGLGFRDVPAAEAAAELRARGLPDGFVADLVWLWEDMAAGGLSVLTEDVGALTGRAPRTFDDWLADGRP